MSIRFKRSYQAEYIPPALILNEGEIFIQFNDEKIYSKNTSGDVVPIASLNASDAQLRDRSTHTGTQAISTVSGLQTALDGKIDSIVAGSGINVDDSDPVNPIVSAIGGSVVSVNEVLPDEHGDISLDIPPAQVNSDWNATDGVAEILNKPEIFSGDYEDLTNKPTIFSGDYEDLSNKPSIPTQGVVSVVAGDNITVDNTDPFNPVISSEGGGGSDGGVESIVAGDGINVDDSDPANPVISATSNEGTEVSTQTGTSYTLVLSDAFKMVVMDNADANTLTVPPNSVVEFPANTRIDLGQDGAGQTTIVAGVGVTIRTPETLKLRKQWSKASLIRRAADVWDLVGDLEVAP